MSLKLGSPLRAPADEAEARQKQTRQSGRKSRCADSALKHRLRGSRPKKAGVTKLVEKSEDSELTPSIPMSVEAKGKAHRLKDCIAVSKKQLKSEIGRKRPVGLRPKRTSLTVGVGGGDTPATVTPGTGEKIRPTASDAAWSERGNLLPVLRGAPAKAPSEGSSSDPRSVGQHRKSTRRSDEGIAPKQTPTVTRGMGQQGDGHDDNGKAVLQPRDRKVGMMLSHASCWREVSWPQVRDKVYRQACQIYVAAKQKRFDRVKNLQSLMVRNWAARLWAVRQVCELNSGKNSAGVDGVCRLSALQNGNWPASWIWGNPMVPCFANGSQRQEKMR